MILKKLLKKSITSDLALACGNSRASLLAFWRLESPAILVTNPSAGFGGQKQSQMKNFDYNSPDGNHDDSETPTKTCPDCDGVGYFSEADPDDIDFDIHETCERCKGTGIVKLTDDEQWHDHQARIDDEAEHANDILYSKS